MNFGLIDAIELHIKERHSMQPVKTKSMYKGIYAIILVTVILVFTISILRLFGPRLSIAESKVCRLFSRDYEQILHSVPSPDNSGFVVYVRNMSCGKQCNILIQLGEKSHPPAIDPFYNRYEMPGECDAQIKWLDYAHFEVTGSSGQTKTLSLTDDFPVLP